MQVGLRNNLTIMAPVDNAGVFTEEAGPFQGELVSQLHHSVPAWTSHERCQLQERLQRQLDAPVDTQAEGKAGHQLC